MPCSLYTDASGSGLGREVNEKSKMYKGKKAREHERTYLANGSFRLEGRVASKLTK